MRPIRILCVCDLGGVTSALLAQYLHEILEEQGYEAETGEATLVCVSEKLADKRWDFVASAVPIQGALTVPVLNAGEFLVGLHQDEFVSYLMKIVSEVACDSSR